jgi:hypothetical protein
VTVLSEACPKAVRGEPCALATTAPEDTAPAAIRSSLRAFTLHDEGAIAARSAAWPWGIEVGPVLTFH